MAQVDGLNRHVYIQFREGKRMQEVLMKPNEHREFRHKNDEIWKVRIEAVGLDTRRVRIANLHPEVPDRALRMLLVRYGGEVKDVHKENWSRAYRYPVAYPCSTYPFTHCSSGTSKIDFV